MNKKSSPVEKGLKLLVLLPFILMSCSLPANLLNGQQPSAAPLTMSDNTAMLTEIVGDVLARLPEEADFAAARQDSILPVKSQVKTLENSRARLDFSSGTVVRLGPNTLFTLQVQQRGADGLFTRIWLEIGQVWVILNGGTLEIETPSGLAAVRGSYVSVSYNPDNQWMVVNCLEGFCSLQNSKGRVDMLAGQASDILDVQLPPRERKMDGAEVQSWLWNHPEATMMIPQLTATVGSLASVTPLPSNTPINTSTPENTATATSTPTVSPTITRTASLTPLPAPAVYLWYDKNCRTGPGVQYPLIGNIPVGWTVTVVGRGTDGSWIVRYPYQPNISCWITAYGVNPNQSAWFVPIYSPPPLPKTLTPTTQVLPSNTPKPTNTSGPVIPTSTKTPTLFPTANTPPTLSNASGPSGTLTVCSNAFSVNAVDGDGIAWVKVQYAIDDPGFSAPRYAGPLPNTASTYAGNLTLSGTTASNKVYWRFIVKDNLGMLAYSYTFNYLDSVGCP